MMTVSLAIKLSHVHYPRNIVNAMLINIVAKYGVCLRFRIIEESGSGVNRDQSEVSTIHSPSLASYNSFRV